MTEIAVVMPARDEGDSVASLVAALAADYRVIVVDDGSEDQTSQLASDAGAIVIQGPPEGHGYSPAVLAGLEAGLQLGADSLVTFDADGAHDPADVLPLLATHQRLGASLTVGNRFGWPPSDDELPTAKRWSNFFASRILHAAGAPLLDDVACGLRAYAGDFASRLVEKAAASGYELPYEGLLLAAEGELPIAAHPVRVRYDAREPMTTRAAEVRALLDVAERHGDGRLFPLLKEIRECTETSRPFEVLAGKRWLYAHPIGALGWLFQAQHRAFVADPHDVLDLDALSVKASAPVAPTHVGVIPDGTRRWARGHGVALANAYAHAVERLESVVDHLFIRGANSVSLYLVSRMNLQRSPASLDAIFAAEKSFSSRIGQVCVKHEARVCVAGDPFSVPESFRQILVHLERVTSVHAARRLYLCVAYDPNEEVVRTVRRGGGTYDPARLEVPEPLDLVIRTGAAKSLSNFLPLQAAYAQLHLLEPLWNELTLEDVDRSLAQCGVIERGGGS